MASIRELIIDPTTNQLSTSRLGLLAMNVVAIVATMWMLVVGTDPTKIVIGVAASDASVYLANSGLRAMSSWRSSCVSITTTEAPGSGGGSVGFSMQAGKEASPCGHLS